MAVSTATISQTRSFTTVFLIEMWERFGFYGMQVLMVTYMMKKLGFVDTRANLVWAPRQRSFMRRRRSADGSGTN